MAGSSVGGWLRFVRDGYRFVLGYTKTPSVLLYVSFLSAGAFSIHALG